MFGMSRLRASVRLTVVSICALAPVAWALSVAPAALAGQPAFAPGAPAAQAAAPVVIYPAAFAVSAPLAWIAAEAPAAATPITDTPRMVPLLRRPPTGPTEPRTVVTGSAAVNMPLAPAGPMPGLLANFDGVPNIDGYYPPDTNGDIGYDPATGRKYYFEWVNMHYAVWDVTNPAAPTVVVPATPGNALWAAALPGSECAQNNDGDPIALFDEQANRWMISQFSLGPSFTGPFHQCVAVSQTADPAGAWYVYDYQYRDGSTYLNDYPKFGVWPDPVYGAYYMSVNQFNSAGTSYLGPGAAAFDRSRLLKGDPSAALVVFGLSAAYYSLLPADLDGAPPPAGTPGLFVSIDNGTPSDLARVWEFRPNWTTPANSTFGLSGSPNYALTVSSFTTNCGQCVPQPGTSTLLDSLDDRAMYRAAFRDFDSYQSLVTNRAVRADASGNRTGVRWFEFQRNPGTGAWSVNQQATYGPVDGIYRWMGSVAMDRQGDMALGFSAGSSTLYPSIRYVGRLVSDTLSTLPQSEVTMTAGSGSQTGQYGRWGDYAMMGVDPQDGCTFWYTNEYVQTTGSVTWRTRIGSFKFPQCTPLPVGTLSGTVAASINGSPISGSLVVALDTPGTGVFTAHTNAAGAYSLIGVPAGAYTVTASASTYVTASVTGVMISNSVTTTQNFGLASVYSVTLTPAASTGSASAGAVATYTLTLTNSGVATDTYGLSVSGNAWPMQAPATVGPLAAGVATSFTVAVTVPAGTLAGVSDVATLTATSLGNVAVSAAVMLTTTALPSYGVQLSPTLASGSALPGAIVTYTLRLTNTGNINDTYSLGVSGSSWPTQAPLTTGSLAVGQGMDVPVAVSVPAVAAPGSSDSATLTSTSQGDGTISTTATLTTTAAYQFFLPIVVR